LPLLRKSKNESVDNEDKPSDFYIVKAGDNLSSIAKKYNVSVEDLKKWNDLPSNSIRLESKLKVADLTADNQEAQETVAKTEIKNVEYIVQNGENLGTIARKNGVTVSDLKMWNDLEDDNVQSGARIVVGKRIIADSSQQVVAEKSTTKKEKATKAKNEIITMFRKAIRCSVSPANIPELQYRISKNGTESAATN
jgi:membrane-bound lytic murein transglycosylase D